MITIELTLVEYKEEKRRTRSKTKILKQEVGFAYGESKNERQETLGVKR